MTTANSAQEWDREVDLLVAGAGPGGLATALVGALEGLDVLVCEKSDQAGGTGSTSAGTLWIPGNTQNRSAGFDDSAADAAKYLDALIGDDDPGGLRHAYLQTGPEAVDYLVERTEVTFLPCGKHPDYQNNLPGSAISGRAIIPETFDGRQLGADFARVRPPIEEFMLLGGMMVGKIDIMQLLGRYKSVQAFTHSAGLVMRYLADRVGYARGTRLVMGNALIGRLFFSLKQAGGELMFDAPVDELIRDGGSEGPVIGASILIDGSPVRVRARRGVVLATGGFAHNRAYREKFMPDPTPTHSMASEHNTGDGLRLAEDIGADPNLSDNGVGGLWTPVSVTRRRDGSKGLYPHLSLDRAKPGIVAVNKAGRRFVNEGLSYHDFVEAMFRSHETVPTIPCWLVCDAPFVRKYGLGAIHPETRNLRKHENEGSIVTAPTVEALAGKIGVDTDGLADTIQRNNDYARKGDDPDFGKGDVELNRFNGDRDHGPNPCLGPIGTAPYIAMEIWPAEIACSVGLPTNADGEVLDKDRRPIGGLYAAGNDMASVMAGSYPGPGTTLGPALVFGYRSAMHAAGKPLDDDAVS